MAESQTPKNVADTATIRAEIDLRRLSLLGVMGTEENPSALLRLPSGETAKVEPGTQVGRQVVAAIDDRGLALADHTGRTTWIQMPETRRGS
ncbi:hypothetical protein SAMN05421853_10824 [Roseivivax halotolerans]|uniref:Type IV pilus assembly protein PilP n=1 Tax=Roseivivax halotolerans TaxID=93684 RepID=A0A1I5Z632_9RHOB|nr:hypothetical protein [Roseivivax halotolerans]SFQ51929.1 hypothetical protein SAMN05421853_10824 [Roseivivax halotolerans]